MKARNNVGPRRETSVPKDVPDTNAQTFTFNELAVATKNFRDECFLGEGGFGSVYKGQLETGQVAVLSIIHFDYAFCCFSPPCTRCG